VNSISGYQITEEIYNSPRTLVYRGYRESDLLAVVIKVLKNPYPSFRELLSFRNQYTITKNLHSPLILKTYSLERYQNGYALVMEDFGGISLKQWGLSESLQQFLEIAIALCNTLDLLYQERIIHKDIKPSNILINPSSKQVKLIDFSIASLLPRETQTLLKANVLEGTLAYISPEQTGRMNRVIDYRTDFYSLGVTLYELLTGKLPFPANDPMEVVHCHIAKTPLLVHEINRQIPSVLSAIVSKLMAKNAEDRYQSALGLKYDLEHCLSQLQETGKIESFEIARRDVCDRFVVSDKLYGREAEVTTLLEAFDRVSQGATEMMLVAGFSGIGKTAVVNEIHKPIVRQRGYFIKGKYDQFQRNIPLSAFVQAFRDLMGQLLTESDTQIQQWKNKILEVVGENGQVIIEVIPELAKIIGQQPAAVELSGTAAENRFNILFQKFTQVFTTEEHPLVIFLDDLQWADSASLKLMQLLIADTGHLLLIGAYRDNEVQPGHALMLTLSNLQKKQAKINTITLTPLTENKVNQLVADTLKCPENLAWNLSILIHQKTQGNPFFATQFLKALYQDGLIEFNFELGCWQCDIAKVKTQAVTDDVVAFISLQLQKLPLLTQQVLQLAACVGNSFDLDTLSIVSQQSPIETAAALWKALQEGLILPINDFYKFYKGEDNDRFLLSLENASKRISEYKFLHDRVQQAAYSLIPDEQKRITHLNIGQLLQKHYSEPEQIQKLFDIVGHLNLGRALITESSEEEALAQLNLHAGRRAKAATAYAAAREYFQIAISLLQSSCWQHQYELALDTHLAAAEASYLNGDFESMEHLAQVILQQARSIFDKVKIYEIQIGAKTVRAQILEAIAIGTEALAELRVDFPKEIDEAMIAQTLDELNQQFHGKEIAGLINLPLMCDRSVQAAMQLLTMLFAPVFQGMPGLLPFLSATMVRLSLQFGNTSTSTVGYAIHGLVLCVFLGEAKMGFEFGQLAQLLVEQLNAKEMKPIVLNLFGALIQHRQQSLRNTTFTLKDSYMVGLETGDFVYAGYSIVAYTWALLFAGVDLDILESELAVYRATMAQMKQESAQMLLDMAWQTIQHLKTTVSQPDCLIGNAYDETVMFPKHQQDKDLNAIAVAYNFKLLLAFWFGNYQAAYDYIIQLEPFLMSLSGFVHLPVCHFYTALTHLVLLSAQPEDPQVETLDKVATHQMALHQAAQTAPINYLHKWYLVEAERQRVLGKKAAAIEFYDCAIAGAKANNYIQEEALAHELAAKFYLDWGKEKVAMCYMQEAYYCYARWGAKAKVYHLEKGYPQLLKPIIEQRQINLNPGETITSTTLPITSVSAQSDNTSTSIADTLDFTSVLKASQTISSNIELNELITSLTQIILQSCGADKSVLILNHDDILQIRAITSINQEINSLQTTISTQLLDGCLDIPVKIINYVKNTQQTIVIDNCQTDITGMIEEYMFTYQPQSVLCTPIINQGNLLGIIYLESRAAAGVFTKERLQVIHILSAQAAIALENARLYQQMQQALHDLQQANLQMVQSEKMSALGNLVAGVAHEMNNPLSFISATLQQIKPTFVDIVKHLQLYQETLPNPGEEVIEHAEEIDLDYTLEDLPKMLNAMVIACDRLQNISTSLRTFSRADKDYKVKCNIHEGIDSTILILKHRFKANEKRPAIEVLTEYGDLPEIECFPGQLNQVFMNILANAIDALDESNIGRSFEEVKANPNKIIIKTSLETNQAKISISDNGKGVSEEVKQKIFDHLFTTKAVGKGTGLGLAIAKQIVEETHGGKLSCNSILGKGTEFIIEIPA
jgi:predicted ATPase/signal transduction histidine kinase